MAIHYHSHIKINNLPLPLIYWLKLPQMTESMILSHSGRALKLNDTSELPHATPRGNMSGIKIS